MAWNHHVDLLPEWEQAKEDEITVKNLIGVIQERFKLYLPERLFEEVEPLLEELGDLELFEDSRHGEDVDTHEFDVIWNQIYDWADARRVWIKTF